MPAWCPVLQIHANATGRIGDGRKARSRVAGRAIDRLRNAADARFRPAPKGFVLNAPSRERPHDHRVPDISMLGPEANRARVVVRGDQRTSLPVPGVEILDDDGRLRGDAIAPRVPQRRKLADGPERPPLCGLRRIGQVDDVPMERRVVFAKRPLQLVAERREQMAIERERHRGGPRREAAGPPAYPHLPIPSEGSMMRGHPRRRPA